jgi:hypothetical protein
LVCRGDVGYGGHDDYYCRKFISRRKFGECCMVFACAECLSMLFGTMVVFSLGFPGECDGGV